MERKRPGLRRAGRGLQQSGEFVPAQTRLAQYLLDRTPGQVGPMEGNDDSAAGFRVQVDTVAASGPVELEPEALEDFDQFCRGECR